MNRRCKKNMLKVTPEEAVELVKFNPVSDYDIVRELYKQTLKTYKNDIKSDEIWGFFFMLLVCWNAGRVEGIRSERAARKIHRQSEHEHKAS